jgi:DNA-directed RNA polymerase specialized sigma24 family protein
VRHNTVQPDRCTAEDYRELFATNGYEFRWFCYALTGNLATRVFREWMSHWARRLIIKSCIVAMNSTIQDAARGYSPPQAHLPLQDSRALELLRKMPLDVLQEKLLALDALSRFVIVLRALEGYSRRETALLLDIDEMTCPVAHGSAIVSIASFSFGETLSMEDQPMTA